jgi:hypothetical protein
MSSFTNTLWTLSEELLPQAALPTLRMLATSRPLSYSDLVAFDLQWPGPGLGRINVGGGPGGTGQYQPADRDIFRPLQYCAMYLSHRGDLDWLARHVVHMSSLHIESLVKRVGEIGRLPLGGLLHQQLVKARLDTDTLRQLGLINQVFNVAKHEVDQPKDTHMFTVEDAVVCFFVCRALALKLYPKASLQTDISNLQ